MPSGHTMRSKNTGRFPKQAFGVGGTWGKKDGGPPQEERLYGASGNAFHKGVRGLNSIKTTGLRKRRNTQTQVTLSLTNTGNWNGASDPRKPEKPQQ